MAIKCVKCSRTIGKNDDYISCRHCLKNSHLSCGGVTTNAYHTMEREGTLASWQCSICIKKNVSYADIGSQASGPPVYDSELLVNSSQTLENLIDNIVRKHVEPLSDLISSMNLRIADLVSENSRLRHEVEAFNRNASTLKNSAERNLLSEDSKVKLSYAESIVRNSQKSFIIKPKQKTQTVQTTKSDLITNIKPVESQLNIGKVKSLKEGGILIGCDDAVKFKEIAKIKQLDSSYEIREVKKFLPRIRISGIADVIDEGSVLKYIVGQNDVIFDGNFEYKLLKFCPVKKNNSVYQAVMEVDLPTYKRAMSVGHCLVGGFESATLVEPRNVSISILGLGNSVGTPPEGILAEVLVVKSFDDLQSKAEQAKGKIVVYNQDFVSYGSSAVYRGKGATKASKVGAVASLIRSITPFSLNTPHTGVQSYGENVTKIPTACITLEDAHFLQRLQDEGRTIKILLKMEAQTLPDTTSRNVVAEIEGTEYPEKVVIVSGHIDSWDVGNGAMDDGGGVFVSWGALALLKSLGLKAKRTVRAIFWTAEEFGFVGAYQYAKDHANDTDNFVFVMESDIGTFNPVGLEYSGGTTGRCIVQEVMKLLAPINATGVRQSPSVGSDIYMWTSKEVPGASLDTENDKYFWYHHSNADTLDVENPDSLDKNTALWASVAYVLADLSVDFPRELIDG
ncbi:hypothetical protein Zmor_001105 [Zophobas morio]|uniref:Carboxypeptidase Q n=1 Tax=Zophobas morio TaxID=2755281 RepID=A0AA38MP17_9CUCU|nr:hypothetical protein Zmor_001105 [Zophobas morio]